MVHQQELPNFGWISNNHEKKEEKNKQKKKGESNQTAVTKLSDILTAIKNNN